MVEAIDAHTVKVTYKTANPYPWTAFTSDFGNIIQKKQFQPFLGANAKDAPGNLAPIGTGPYKVTDFKPGDVVSYTLNDFYRDPNKPYFHDVQIKGGGDAVSAARAVFQTGETDYSWNLQVEAQVLNQLAQGGKANLVTAPGPDRRAHPPQLRGSECRRRRRTRRARYPQPVLRRPECAQGVRDGRRPQVDW